MLLDRLEYFPLHAQVDVADKLASGIAEGQLSTRIDAERQGGAFRKVTLAINGALQSFSAPITEVNQVLSRISERDLTARMVGHYRGDFARTKEALNATAGALHDAMAQVAESANQVSAASGQIASSSQAVASGASEQASSLEQATGIEQINTAMTQMNSVTQQNAASSEESSSAAAELSGQAEELAAMVDSFQLDRAAKPRSVAMPAKKAAAPVKARNGARAASGIPLRPADILPLSSP